VIAALLLARVVLLIVMLSRISSLNEELVLLGQVAYQFIIFLLFQSFTLSELLVFLVDGDF
jgi:hypothetical protein